MLLFFVRGEIVGRKEWDVWGLWDSWDLWEKPLEEKGGCADPPNQLTIQKALSKVRRYFMVISCSSPRSLKMAMQALREPSSS